MKMWTFILALTGALLLASCCSSREGATTRRQEARRQEARRYEVLTLTATVEGITVSGQVRIAHDSIIWASANKIVEVGRALATRDSVWVRSTWTGLDVATDYAGVEKAIGQRVTFDMLQGILESGDAERRIAELARRLGYQATVKITRRERVERLTFPYNKRR